MSEPADTMPACIVCHRPGALTAEQHQTCTRCLGRVRVELFEIQDLYATLPAVMLDRAGAAAPLDISGVRSDREHPMPGGDALALAADGSTGRLAIRAYLSDHIDSSHYEDNGDDTPSVLAALAGWEDIWRRERHEVAGGRATITGVVAALDRRLTWAAQQYDGFDVFATEIRDIARTLRRVTGNETPVDRGKGIHCPDCEAGALIRPYRDRQRPTHGSLDQGGRTDHWECQNPACGARVSQRSYWLHVAEEKRQRLAREAS